VQNLFANGVQMTLARSPNSGFFPLQRRARQRRLPPPGSISLQVTGTARTFASELRITRLRLASFPLSMGTTITLVSAPLRRMKAGEGFYLDNTLAALDSAGEWYCDPATNSVYFWAPGDVDPNTMTVEGSFLDYGVNSSQKQHYGSGPGVQVSSEGGSTV